MAIQEQFDKAVKIVQSLPKNGPVKPTQEDQLDVSHIPIFSPIQLGLHGEIKRANPLCSCHVPHCVLLLTLMLFKTSIAFASFTPLPLICGAKHHTRTRAY